MNDDQFNQLMEKLDKIQSATDNRALTWTLTVILIVYSFNS